MKIYLDIPDALCVNILTAFSTACGHNVVTLTDEADLVITHSAAFALKALKDDAPRVAVVFLPDSSDTRERLGGEALANNFPGKVAVVPAIGGENELRLISFIKNL